VVTAASIFVASTVATVRPAWTMDPRPHRPWPPLRRVPRHDRAAVRSWGSRNGGIGLADEPGARGVCWNRQRV